MEDQEENIFLLEGNFKLWCTYNSPLKMHNSSLNCVTISYHIIYQLIPKLIQTTGYKMVCKIYKPKTLCFIGCNNENIVDVLTLHCKLSLVLSHLILLFK